tara:strand:- start:1658 stop:2776 length:1119 start_codon:yes stop_codon:yes gene_type:complete
MTPAEELALLDQLSADVEAEVLKAYQRAMDLMRAGVAPRDAITRVMDSFTGEYAELMSNALSAILQRSVGTAAALEIRVGTVSLSRKLYVAGDAASNVVAGIVRQNTRGYQDARTLALQLFEGYSFREPGAEPLQIRPDNPKLPKYMREVLDPDPVRRKMAQAFARLQVDGLSTPALRAAYSEALDAIEDIQGTVGRVELEKALKTAFYERMRYFAERIARTEAHRAYAQREAQMLLDDEEVEYVQIRRSRTSTAACICDLIAGRDQYGLGRGVYPKPKAPNPPFHPFCKCISSPRLDLNGRRAQEDSDADQYFLNRLSEPLASKIVGSRDKLARVLAGEPALAVHNAGSDPAYRIVNLEQAASAYSATGPR